MTATIIAVLLNLCLTPYSSRFRWGIRGVAIATILAQIVALAWQLRLFSHRGELLYISREIFRWSNHIVHGIIKIGMSPFLMNMASCMVVILINKGLKTHGGDLAIGAFGIVNRISFIFLMIVMGLNQGMQPIAGYNYGALHIDRVKKVFRLTAISATAVTTLGFLIGELIPQLTVRIFTTDTELIEYSIYGMRIIMATFPIVGVQMVISNFFQSIGMANKAIILSLSRQVLFLIPCLLILPQFFDILGVWVSIPVSDIAAFAVALCMIIALFRKWNKHPETIYNTNL
jgi:Na+-driven multidrug efflux pump